MSAPKSDTPPAVTLTRADTLKLATAGGLVLIALVTFYLLAGFSLLGRVIGLLIAMGMAITIALRTTPGVEAIEFLRGARAELRKVVWPTRAETTQTTLIVIAMVVIMGLLLWVLDAVLFWIVRWITS